MKCARSSACSKTGRLAPPLSEGCGAEPGVSERARDGRGAPRAVGPLAPARLLQGYAQCSRSSAGSTQPVLSRREPPLGSCLQEVARPWSAASRDTSADSRCASGGERIITVPITVIYR